jgi:hypothetical protein
LNLIQPIVQPGQDVRAGALSLGRQTHPESEGQLWGNHQQAFHAFGQSLQLGRTQGDEGALPNKLYSIFLIRSRISSPRPPLPSVSGPQEIEVAGHEDGVEPIERPRQGVIVSADVTHELSVKDFLKNSKVIHLFDQSLQENPKVSIPQS